MRRLLSLSCALACTLAPLTGCDDGSGGTAGSGGMAGSGGTAGSGGMAGDGGSGGATTTGVTLPDEILLDGDAWPEDVKVAGSRVLTSNWVTGGVQVYDLEEAPAKAEVLAPPTGSAYTAYWGLHDLPSKGWLLAITNVPYAFDGNVAQPGIVRAYDPATGAEQKAWTLPDGSVGNSVDAGAGGEIYVGDVGPGGRILKIDPATDQVAIWKDKDDWGDGPFGLGGMVFDGESALYTAAHSALWRVPILGDGTAGTAEKVELTDGDGAPFPKVFADGMAWAGNGTLYYAENDAQVEGPHGVIYKVVLASPTKGTVTVEMESLKDPSGVAFAKINGKDYLFVGESQFGHLFQFDPGPPGPFRVHVHLLP